MKYRVHVPLAVLMCLALPAHRASAAPFTFNTGNVNGQMAAATRPDTGGKLEIETGDDFKLTDRTSITSATFTGLFTAGITDLSSLVVEIYRVFPLDSDTTRTPQVPTRVNSPSDVAFDSRDGSDLSFTATSLGAFTAANSVKDGIHPQPFEHTGGEGPVSGTEGVVSVTFNDPFVLDPGHYFFVPQVATSTGDFYWLSSVRPIVAPGTPFAPDLQAWIRNENLAPDWLRIGTDIVGGATPPTFNMAFSLEGKTVPEPTTGALLVSGLLGLVARRRAARRA